MSINLSEVTEITEQQRECISTRERPRGDGYGEEAPQGEEAQRSDRRIRDTRPRSKGKGQETEDDNKQEVGPNVRGKKRD